MTFPRDVPRLTDGRVTLRAHGPSDAAAVLEQSLDPLSRRWTTVPLEYTLDDARRFVCGAMPAGWEHDAEWGFALEVPDGEGEPRYGGTVSLRNRGEGRAEVAYGSHPWVRGRGFMERALRLLLTWGFEERRLRTVMWWANEGNWASRKLAWRVGFRVEGRVRSWLTQRGELLDGWVGTLRATDPMQPAHRWLDAPRIAGARCSLRPHRPDDAARVLEACADPLTQYWLSQLPRPYTLRDAQEYVDGRMEDMASGTAVHWAVADSSSDELVGSVSLFPTRAGLLADQAEVGYWSHPAARGRGVITEACRLAVRHAFVDPQDGGLGMRRVRAIAAEGNAASRRVLERNGFLAVGRERAATVLGDRSVTDAIQYDLLLDDWNPPRP